MIHTLTVCKSCNALVVWMKTVNGKHILVNYKGSVPAESMIFDPKTMEAHFATCPQADMWRKKKKV